MIYDNESNGNELQLFYSNWLFHKKKIIIENISWLLLFTVQLKSGYIQLVYCKFNGKLELKKKKTETRMTISSWARKMIWFVVSILAWTLREKFSRAFSRPDEMAHLHWG